MKTPEDYRKVFFSNTGNKEVAVTVDLTKQGIVITCSNPNQTVSVTLSEYQTHELTAHLTALANEPLED